MSFPGRSFAVAAVFVALTTGCNIFAPSGRKMAETSSPAATIPAPKASATISSTSAETQILEDGGATVAFRPGTLSIDAQVSIGAGGDLSGDVLSELGIAADKGATGASVIIDSDGTEDPVGTLAITLPIPATGELALQANNLVVVYRVVVKATGEYMTGVIPQSGFSGYDATTGTVTIASDHFGQFQTMYVNAKIDQKVEKKSAQRGFKDASGALQASVTKADATPSDATKSDDDSQQALPVPPKDTTGPKATLATESENPTATTPVLFKATFDEDVADFAPADVWVSSGTVTGFRKVVDGYEFEVTSPANGDLIVYIKDKAVKDAADNWSTVSNTIKIAIDQAAPEISFTTANGLTVPVANRAASPVAGTCDEPGRSVTITYAQTTVTTTCTSSKTFSMSLNLAGVPAGILNIHAQIIDSVGNEGHADLTVRTLEILTVSPEYAVAPNWMDHVRMANTAQACDGSESGSYSGSSAVCVDGGPRRKVVISIESACTGLTATDQLGLFTWECAVNGSTVTFHSRLRDGAALSDQIDASGLQFLTNSVTVLKNGNPISQSLPATWWSNSFAVLGSAAPNTFETLNVAGRIYTIVAAVNRGLVQVGADKTALVVMPGASLTSSAPNTDNCPGDDGDATITATCLVYLPGNHFVRLEGAFANSAGRFADVGILVKDSRFITLTRLRLQAFGYDPYGSGLRVYTTDDVLGTDVKIKNTSGDGIVMKSNEVTFRDLDIANSGSYLGGNGAVFIGGTHGVIQRASFTNNASAGLAVSYTDQWTISEILAASNHADGISSFYNDHLVIEHATVALNYGDGLVLQQTTNAGLNGILSFNNTLGFAAIGGDPASMYAVQPLTLADVLSANSYSLPSNSLGSSPTGAGVFLQQDAGASGCDLSGFSGPPSCNVVTGLASTFRAPTGSVAANAPLDFMNVAASWQSWGIYGSRTTSDPSNREWCTGANSCQLYDWGVAASAPTALAYVSGVFAANQACPVTGADTFTGPNGATLKDAFETLFDDKGNDNGLCEAGEACVFTPHVGGYQGEGGFTNSCTFSPASGIAGVTLVGYQTTHR